MPAAAAYAAFKVCGKCLVLPHCHTIRREYVFAQYVQVSLVCGVDRKEAGCEVRSEEVSWRKYNLTLSR